MENVIFITTGGTIAMAESETDGVKPQDPMSLQDVLPLLNRHAHVQMEHLFNMPSPHITPYDMFRIAERVQFHLDQPEITGVVITHGTDTLEETAYFLDLVIQSEKSVVVTGAMRSQNELGSDGPYNMVNAVRVAAHPRATYLGALVVFNDEIHAARTVTKTHTSNVSTFLSPSLGPLGLITKKEIQIHRHVVREQHLPLLAPTMNVPLFKVVAGMDDALIKWAIDQQVDGMVIEALGQGNVPPAMLPGMQLALERGIPIVLVSRCYNGIVQDTYDYEGGGKQLKRMGLIFSNGINGPKARIKLMLALHVTREIEALRGYFQW